MKRKRSLTSNDQGSDDMNKFWTTSTFSVFAGGFAATSERKFGNGEFGSSQDPDESNPIGDELLDVLADEYESKIILVGRINGRGSIKAFRIPTGRFYGMKSLDNGLTISKNYDPMTDDCCLLDDLDTDEKGILVANIDRRRKECTLSMTPFPRS